MFGLSNRVLQILLFLIVALVAGLLAAVLAAVLRTTGTTDRNVQALLERTERQAEQNGEGIACVVEFARLLSDPNRDQSVPADPPKKCERVLRR